MTSETSKLNVRGFVFDLDGTLVDSKIDFASMKSELRLDREVEGALEFVQSVKAAGMPCVIFTHNARSLAQKCLRRHGFEIEVVVAREDAPPKPKPDGLFKIAGMLGVNVRELLFVGDYLYDLQAGLAAAVPEKNGFQNELMIVSLNP